MEIRKRNGESVPFQQEKIFNAMKKAFDGQGREIGSRELNEILAAVLDNLAAAAPLTVERVQDEVERTLMERGYYEVAKAYILYREKRSALRRVRHTIAQTVGDDSLDEVLRRIQMDFTEEVYSLAALQMKFESFCHPGMTEDERAEALTKAAVELTTAEAPKWEFVAARLLNHSFRCRNAQEWEGRGVGDLYGRLRYLTDKGLYGDYNGIRDTYKCYLDESRKSVKDIRSRILCVSRFLKLVEERGVKELSNLSVNDIYAAFQESTDKGRFRRLVGHFLTYAYKYGLIEENLYLVIPSPIRHKAVPSVFSPDEVEQIISAIDRTTNIGKRNYAVVLIAARLGLRASDIAGLTFSSLSTKDGKVRITQKKTKQFLTLPLLAEVRDAIDDYINHARQNTADDHVFLNVANNDPLTAANVGKIVEMTITASGIDTTNKRRGSHRSMRHHGHTGG